MRYRKLEIIRVTLKINQFIGIIVRIFFIELKCNSDIAILIENGTTFKKMYESPSYSMEQFIDCDLR